MPEHAPERRSVSIYPHWGSFESTKIHGSGEDVLSTTRHTQRWRQDLALLREAGLRELRYPAPWHRVERLRGEYDFRWLDGPMEEMRRTGMRPILDPLHHTSFPDWLEGGFANPAFPALYVRFVERVAQRYPWVTDYTVFNEPLPTTLLCSYTGHWYPHGKSDREFVSMSLRVCRAICEVTAMLMRTNPRIRFVHIDACESHSAMERGIEEWVEYAQHRRFLLHDLVLGRVDRGHPLYGYLVQNGAAESELSRLRDQPAKIDVLGLDYYPHSEMDWFWSEKRKGPDRVRPVERPRGFAAVARDYTERYRLPVAVGETNVRGTVTDRLTWLRHMEEQTAELAESGVPVEGFCWFPSIDSTDWCHLCARCTHSVDPQGIWWLDAERWERHHSELSDCYAALAKGQLEISDLPAYRLQEPLDQLLRGYVRSFMSHWSGWLEPLPAEQVA
ncbi:MAG: family 1 glycosylhydrolase [Bryobacteraceae bacterium]|nr:family 1 glycosylhydrolase [Bryobacteraceae bacterium]